MTATTSVNCYYCGKPCDAPVETGRAWIHPKQGRVTCCNSCGGYETCPSCGKLWENLFSPKGTPCDACNEEDG